MNNRILFGRVDEAKIIKALVSSDENVTGTF